MRAVALILTLLTGFSALVYEVVWQKYLAALLGSHSEATVAVLGIFLGALSLGYALFGRVTQRLVRRAAAQGRAARILTTYGVVEGAIGLYALAFPWLFEAGRAASLLLPAGAPGLSFAFDVGLSALLIGPPVVLMGGTIPLLTQGLARDVADATRFHSLVYAFNTVGAVAGALCAGFLLVPWLGLSRSLVAMGLVNLAAGTGFLLLGRRRLHGGSIESEDGCEQTPADFATMAWVALLLGFAMMSLQVVMNRIGALSLGASHLTFSMVVATFVACIALGSFAVAGKREIAPWLLPAAHWSLVGCLLLLYPAFEDAPYWAHRLRSGFGNEQASLLPFQLSVFGSVLLVFLVPLGISGAILPLLFHQLRRQVGHLGRVAGRLYSWNTAGSLLGALLGGFALLFWFDLHHVYRLALFALSVGAALVTWCVHPRRWGVATAALAVAVTVVLLLPAWAPKRLSSGLFRMRAAVPFTSAGPSTFFENYRSEWPADYVVFYDDGPSNSVAVNRRPIDGGRTSIDLINNGKSDSAIPADNVTTGMASLVPAMLAGKRERVLVIGFGTGMSVGVLTGLDSVHEIVVAEISQAVMDAAPWFEAANGGALASPKTRVVHGDAYRTLLRGEELYDLIVSEPSNPWVTGVELLYTRDFLQAARERLAPGGIHAQWIHTYETDQATLELVFQTFRSVFGRTSVWYTRGPDLLLLGFRDMDHESDLDVLERRWSHEGFAQRFAALGMDSLAELLAHELLPMGVLDVGDLPEQVHTVAHPILSHRAARAFFSGQLAALPEILNARAREVGAERSLLRRYKLRQGGRLPTEEQWRVVAEVCSYRIELCATMIADWASSEPDSPELRKLVEAARGSPDHAAIMREELQRALAILFNPATAELLPTDYETAEQVAQVYRSYYHHAAPFSADALEQVWRACADDPRCAARLEALRSEAAR